MADYQKLPQNGAGDERQESEALPCQRHPHNKTRLRCTECDTPICPKCMVMYEVGFKCPACAKKRPSHLVAVTSLQILGTSLACVLMGWICGWIFTFALAVLPIRIFMFPVLGYLALYGLGQLCGHGLQRLLHYKYSPKLIVCVLLAVVAGLLLSSPVQMLLMGTVELVLASITPHPLDTGSSSVLGFLSLFSLWIGPFCFVRGLWNPFIYRA